MVLNSCSREHWSRMSCTWTHTSKFACNQTSFNSMFSFDLIIHISKDFCVISHPRQVPSLTKLMFKIQLFKQDFGPIAFHCGWSHRHGMIKTNKWRNVILRHLFMLFTWSKLSRAACRLASMPVGGSLVILMEFSRIPCGMMCSCGVGEGSALMNTR